MVERHRRAVDDAHRLAVMAAQERAESIRQQISAANTVLVLANTEFEQGRVRQADALLDRMRDVGRKIRSHLGEPKHVPRTEAAELFATLEHMESRIRSLANRINALMRR